MKSLKWLYGGISALAICMGLLIGLSSDPVVGVYLTSVFGFAGGILTYLSTKEKMQGTDKAKKDISTSVFPSYNVIGKGVSIYSVFLLVSVLIGIVIKIKQPLQPVAKTFVWGKENEPETIDEALDWIVLQDKLIERGFSKKSIEQLYKLKNKRDTFLTKNVMKEEKDEPSDNIGEKSKVKLDVIVKTKGLSLQEDEYYLGPADEDVDYDFTARSRGISGKIPDRTSTRKTPTYLSGAYHNSFNSSLQRKVDSLSTVIQQLRKTIDSLATLSRRN